MAKSTDVLQYRPRDNYSDQQPPTQSVFGPTTGETPLPDLPADSWAEYVSKNTSGPTPGWEGGGDIGQRFAAQKEFRRIFGRNPTESELSYLSSAFASGDPNLLNSVAGRATIAQYYQSVANSPENVERNRLSKLKEQSPQYYDRVNSLFQSSLGRDADQQEKEHFGSLLAQGTADDYTLKQYLDALPENVRRQDEAFRTNINNTLQSQDSQYYREQILPALQSRAVKQGRSLDASGVQNSLALAAQQQNRQREDFLSNLTAQQYAGSQGLTQDAYLRAYGQQQNFQDYSRQRNDYLTDSLTGRINSLNDYAIQRQAYDQYLQRYGKRNNLGGILQGAIGGAGTGFQLGGLWGAVGGAGLGAFAGSQY